MINIKNNKETAPANPLPESKSASAQPEAPPTTSDIELVIRYSRAVESLLGKRLGACGTGLHEKITSVENRLGAPLVKRLRWIATMRNKVVHEEGFALPDVAAYEAMCKKCMEEVERVKVCGDGEAAQSEPHDTSSNSGYVRSSLLETGMQTFALVSVVAVLCSVKSGHVWFAWAVFAVPLVYLTGVVSVAMTRLTWPILRYAFTGNAEPLANAYRNLPSSALATVAVRISRFSVRVLVAVLRHYGAGSSTTPARRSTGSMRGISAQCDDNRSSAGDGEAHVSSLQINPANGLPMVEGTLMDVGGNVYGSDTTSSFDTVSSFDTGAGWTGLD